MSTWNLKQTGIHFCRKKTTKYAWTLLRHFLSWLDLFFIPPKWIYFLIKNFGILFFFIFPKNVRALKNIWSFSKFFHVFQKMSTISSVFPKMFKFSNFVHAFKKRLGIFKNYHFTNFVHKFTKKWICERFMIVLQFYKVCHIYQNNIEFMIVLVFLGIPPNLKEFRVNWSTVHRANQVRPGKRPRRHVVG